jgi:sRNA-binding protein
LRLHKPLFGLRANRIRTPWRAREQESKRAREQESKRAREQASKRASEQASKRAREQESKRAREPTVAHVLRPVLPTPLLPLHPPHLKHCDFWEEVGVRITRSNMRRLAMYVYLMEVVLREGFHKQ